MTGSVPMRRGLFSFASSIAFAVFLSVLLLANSRSVLAVPIPSVQLHAIPAFARKYGMPCSACHEVWPKLNNFGQTFKDNGYQLGNDRDAPVFQQPAYWPIALRITPHWNRENTDRRAVDTVPGNAKS